MVTRLERHNNSPVSGFFQFVKTVLIVSFLFGTLLLVNVIQVLSLLVRPFSSRLFRNINRHAAGFWWSLCVLVSEKFAKIKPSISGDTIPVGENSLIFSNHQSAVDIIALMVFARKNQAICNLKWFVKDVLKYVPGVGWGMLFLDCVFVKRNWESDATRLKSVFSKINNHHFPFWLISFSEGTRITNTKLKNSQEFAAKKGLPVLNHVLLPRTNGFTSAVKGLSGSLRAVYDLTIIYPDGIPTLWQYCSGLSPRFEIHVRRFPISTLPQEKQDLANWLRNRFQIKDEEMSQVFV